MNEKEAILNILREYGIDTTKHQYELRAETYERYTNGNVYTRRFVCPGDYLAYFSMLFTHGPTVEGILDHYGTVEEFAEVVDANPTVEDIHDVASSSWWGDGGDYIIYLKNLSTGETLYEGSDPEYEYDEADTW